MLRADVHTRTCTLACIIASDAFVRQTCAHACADACSIHEANWTDIPAELQEFSGKSLSARERRRAVRTTRRTLRSLVDLFVRSLLPFKGRTCIRPPVHPSDRSSFLSRQLAVPFHDWRGFRIYNVPPSPQPAFNLRARRGWIGSISQIDRVYTCDLPVAEFSFNWNSNSRRRTELEWEIPILLYVLLFVF